MPWVRSEADTSSKHALPWWIPPCFKPLTLSMSEPPDFVLFLDRLRGAGALVGRWSPRLELPAGTEDGRDPFLEPERGVSRGRTSSSPRRFLSAWNTQPDPCHTCITVDQCYMGCNTCTGPSLSCYSQQRPASLIWPYIFATPTINVFTWFNFLTSIVMNTYDSRLTKGHLSIRTELFGRRSVIRGELLYTWGTGSITHWPDRLGGTLNTLHSMWQPKMWQPVCDRLTV